MSTPIDQLAQISAVTGDLVAGVRDEQWTAPTPCTDWTVRQLVDHVVFGNRLFTDVLAGTPLPPRAELIELRQRDHLGDDAVAAYQDSVAGMLAAFGRPGALDQVVRVPFGEVPGIGALHLRLVEALVHGWDLARATGRATSFPDELVEQELAFTRARLGDVAAAPPGQGPFAAPQPVDDDAPPIDRLAALLGRPVSRPSR